MSRGNIDTYFDSQDCPVCGSRDKRTLFDGLVHTCNVLKKTGIALNNAEVPADINTCRNCGHKYLSLTLKDEYLNYYYGVVESEYYDTVRANPLDRRSRETKKFAKFISRHCTNGKNVLEIGSGMGHLLFELKEMGFNCSGVEPSHFASRYSRENFHLDIITGLLDGQTYPGRKFDIIILSDVVEHISGINPLFSLVDHYLAPGGKVVVLTGDSNSLYAKICGRKWLYFFSWEHISFFNKRSVTRLFTNHAMRLGFFKKIHHSGTWWENVRIFLLTLRGMLANFIGARNHKFYYMSFDHFIAIGTKPNPR